ncbi:RNA polymerase subunit sigma-70 [Cellulomonas persica]|uniref:HTH domain-containing protein n=1 Tax=Cellulomonas persica TaxID=76861 RepID=A0A510UU91_9CELL|nr:RNA polymerase subunit sigma-70 [Cellulomonas persica]GEK18237.1 HTH domain-containing protein [Cellulomonas persica]
MTGTDALLTAAGSAEPAEGLRAVRSLRTLADRLETLQVERARRLGWSWQQIADCLGVTRQAVHKKYGKSDKVVR